MIKNRETVFKFFSFLVSSKRKGFTLIELLVVISIIGVLATLLMANVAGVRERARDAQRKSDINQTQKALELYKNSQTTPIYPASLDSLAPNFIKTRPHDPKCPGGTCTGNWVDYPYTRDATDTLKYTLWACLENKSDPQKDSDQTGCPASCKTTAGGVCYTRTEP